MAMSPLVQIKGRLVWFDRTNATLAKAVSELQRAERRARVIRKFSLLDLSFRQSTLAMAVMLICQIALFSYPPTRVVGVAVTVVAIGSIIATVHTNQSVLEQMEHLRDGAFGAAVLVEGGMEWRVLSYTLPDGVTLADVLALNHIVINHRLADYLKATEGARRIVRQGHEDRNKINEAWQQFNEATTSLGNDIARLIDTSTEQ